MPSEPLEALGAPGIAEWRAAMATDLATPGPSRAGDHRTHGPGHDLQREVPGLRSRGGPTGGGRAGEHRSGVAPPPRSSTTPRWWARPKISAPTPGDRGRQRPDRSAGGDTPPGGRPPRRRQPAPRRGPDVLEAPDRFTALVASTSGCSPRSGKACRPQTAALSHRQRPRKARRLGRNLVSDDSEPCLHHDVVRLHSFEDHPRDLRRSSIAWLSTPPLLRYRVYGALFQASSK
jgi:hypothetical protein